MACINFSVVHDKLIFTEEQEKLDLSSLYNVLQFTVECILVTVPKVDEYILQEDGVSKIDIEDDSGQILQDN